MSRPFYNFRTLSFALLIAGFASGCSTIYDDVYSPRPTRFVAPVEKRKTVELPPESSITTTTTTTTEALPPPSAPELAPATPPDLGGGIPGADPAQPAPALPGMEGAAPAPEGQMQ